MASVGSGPAFSISGAPLYSRSGKIAWGPAFDILVLPNIRGAETQVSRITGGGLTSISMMGVFRRNPTGFEVAASLGLVTGLFAGSSNSIEITGGVRDSPISWKAPVGPRAALRMGWIWSSGVGLAISSSIGVVGDSHVGVVPITVLGNLTYSSW
jgi:hypothetical protein